MRLVVIAALVVSVVAMSCSSSDSDTKPKFDFSITDQDAGGEVVPGDTVDPGDDLVGIDAIIKDVPNVEISTEDTLDALEEMADGVGDVLDDGYDEVADDMGEDVPDEPDTAEVEEDATCDCTCQCADAPDDQVCGQYYDEDTCDSGSFWCFAMFNACIFECLKAEFGEDSYKDLDVPCEDLGYQPVCGLDGTTYDNDCELKCAEIELDYKGECGDCEALYCADEDYDPMEMCIDVGTEAAPELVTVQNVCEWKCYFGDPTLAPAEAEYIGECKLWQDCPACDQEEEALLCGENPDGTYTTYPNLCYVYNCAPVGTTVACSTSCMTDDEYNYGCFFSDCDPQCGADGEVYYNACALGYHAMDLADDEASCFCPAEEAPVCGELFVQTYKNECYADYYYDTVWYDGECICECDMNVVAEVCGDDGVTYDNQCALECAGATYVMDGACECTDEYAPVCGSDGNTWANACLATAAGVDIADATDMCANCHTLCDDATIEVGCGSNGVTYPNSCVANKCNVNVYLDCKQTCPCE